MTHHSDDMDQFEKARQRFLDGLALQEKGALEQAERAYHEALALVPERPSVMNNLAAVCLGLKKYAEAERLCVRLLKMDPDDEGALVNLGICQLKLGAPAEALLTCDKVLKSRPGQTEALNNRAAALLNLGRPEEALTSCEQALAIKPDFADAFNNRGNVLLELGRTEEALASYEHALAIRPGLSDALHNRGNVLLRLGRDEEANACFRSAIMLRPHDADGYFRFGDALSLQHRWDEATTQYERALELNPASADAQYGLAVVRLFLHDFGRAWPGYEQRLATAAYRKQNFRDREDSVALYERLERWRGPGEAGVQEVAIWAEQGIGDQVLFSTLIPELIRAGVALVYEIDYRMVAAYQRAFAGVRFVPWKEPPGETLRQADRVLAAGSLPGLFRRSREAFARQPAKLLGALPDRVAYYRKRLEMMPGWKVALSWRSTRDHWWASRKSLPLAQFTPLLKVGGAQFLDVQYGDTAVERRAVEAAAGVPLVRFDEVDYFNDLEEVLAILEACDLVITTSNATAHFAGALGKRTWLLYLADQAPFHYWAHGGSHRSLWYPSVEIVTAPHFTNWASLIEGVRERLSRELPQA